MAAKNTRIGFVSHSGEDPTFTLDPTQFEQLEQAYGRALPDVARKYLMPIVSAYMGNRRDELSWQTWKDVAALLPSWAAAASAVWKVAYDQSENRDSDYQFRQILDAQFANHIVATGDALVIQQEEGWTKISEVYNLPGNQIGVRLSKEVLQRIAMTLTVAVSAAKKEIEEAAEDDPLDSAPNADRVVLLRLTDWAKLFGLPHGPYVDGSLPSKFASFAASLLSMVKEPYRSTKSCEPGAVAERIKRAKQWERTRKREQTLRAKNAERTPYGSI